MRNCRPSNHPSAPGHSRSASSSRPQHAKNWPGFVGSTLMRMLLIQHVNERAELVAVAGDLERLPDATGLRIFAGLGVPVGWLWVADTLLPHDSLLPEVVEPSGEHQGFV